MLFTVLIDKRRKLFFSTDAEKEFDKDQHLLMKKTLWKLRIEEILLNSVKVFQKKLTAYFTFNRQTLNSFPLRQERRQC